MPDHLVGAAKIFCSLSMEADTCACDMISKTTGGKEHISSQLNVWKTPQPQITFPLILSNGLKIQKMFTPFFLV